MPTTVLLVDDHPLFRKGLQLVLKGEPDIQVTGEAGDGLEAIERVRELSPDVVVMDITMPNLNGIEATRRIVTDFPRTKIIALSIHSGKRFVEDMLRAGAVGYVLKDSVPEELVGGIRAVMQGGVYLTPSIKGILVFQHVKALSRSQSSGETDNATSADLIIDTKLYRPRITSDHLHRPQLLQQLDSGCRQPLTLISAPAGYGKSTLVSQWLEMRHLSNAWIFLDENDNDLRVFMRYFLVAVQSMFPTLDFKTPALLDAPDPLPVAVWARYLKADLERIDEPFVLVLDDIHCIEDNKVHNLINALLNQPPRFMRLVLVGRRDPYLPISNLRARGQVIEIRMHDLRFTTAETAMYLQQVMGDEIDASIAAERADMTEGWITGLRLSAHPVSSLNADNLSSGLCVNYPNVSEYFFTEVISPQTPGVRRFLMQTAILNRFCAPLCDAVCRVETDMGKDNINSHNLIDLLNRENMFIIKLDTENHWFRYHHLFQLFLQNQLKYHCSSEEIAALHIRAGDWFSAHGFIEEAIGHAMSAEDTPYAMQLVKQHRHGLMNREAWPSLIELLGFFPGNVVEAQPELLFLKGWMAMRQSRYPDVAAAIDRAESLIGSAAGDATAQRCLQGEIHALRSCYSYYEKACAKETIRHAEQALNLLIDSQAYARGQSAALLCGGYQVQGDLNRALKLADDRPQPVTAETAVYRARMLTFLCYLYWLEADLLHVQEMATRCLHHAQKWNLPETMTWANCFFGITCYQRNDLAAAENCLKPAVKDLSTGQAINGIHMCYALALVFQSQGKPQKARETADTASTFAMEIQNKFLTDESRAFQAELALRQGRMREAWSWARQYDPEPFAAMHMAYVPQLTFVKVLLTAEGVKNRRKAADLLGRLHDFALTRHSTRWRIDVLAIQALYYQAEGDEHAALEKLNEALSLAEPGGFIRPFLDLGAPISALLKRLVQKKRDTSYILKLLDAFLADSGGVGMDTYESGTVTEPSTAIRPAVELTNRELDVLGLLGQRFSNKEIAEKLIISPKTVKSHLKNIYQKLNAANRRQAVEIAKKLEVLK